LNQEDPHYRYFFQYLSSRKKAVIFSLAVLLGIALELYIHLFLRISIVYTHYFYIVIILAGLWYYQRAVYIALFFGALQVLVSWVILGYPSLDSFLRAIMFCIVAFVIGTLSAGVRDEHIELRSANEQLSLSKNAFELANRKLNLLSTITRHDIINQLTALSGNIDYAKLLPHEPEMEVVLEKEDEIVGTINRLISFTKDYQDIGVNAPQWQDVGALINRARSLLGNTPFSFENRVHGVQVYADPLLERIFYNLVDNAVRHAGKPVNIIFSTRDSPDGILIICEDNGVGVPDDEKEQIFLRGYGKNTGFGLFLTREILGITGLTIRETGTSGSGARFEIFVPGWAYRVKEGMTA
jgi:signal transduction histidine kinase